jgi:hypothetical protein
MLEETLNKITAQADKKLQSVISDRDSRIELVNNICKLFDNYKLITISGYLILELDKELSFDQYNKIVELETPYVSFKNIKHRNVSLHKPNKYEVKEAKLNKVVIDIRIS